MATPAQVLANRANALRSTGPRTEEGKANSRSNAVRHGLTSTAVVLPNESREEYENLRDGIIEDLAPASAHEHALAVVIAETFWRRQRLYRLESAFFSFRMNALLAENDSFEQGDAALVQLFTDPTEMTRARLLLRYITAAERAYKQAVADFEKARAAREASREVSDTDPETQSEPDLRIGFVSQPSPNPVEIVRAQKQKAAGPLAGTSGFLNTCLTGTD